LICIQLKENGFSMQLLFLAFFNCWFNDSFEQLFCNKFGFFAAFASASNDVASDGFYLLFLKKTNNLFFLESEVHFTDFLCLQETD
jgi:hypothetical protein